MLQICMNQIRIVEDSYQACWPLDPHHHHDLQPHHSLVHFQLWHDASRNAENVNRVDRCIGHLCRDVMAIVVEHVVRATVTHHVFHSRPGFVSRTDLSQENLTIKYLNSSNTSSILSSTNFKMIKWNALIAKHYSSGNHCCTVVLAVASNTRGPGLEPSNK